MVILDNFERFPGICDINQNNLSKIIPNEHVLTPRRMYLYDCDCVALEVLVLLVHLEAVILFLGVSVIHP